MPVELRGDEGLDRNGLEALQRRRLSAGLSEVLVSNGFYRRKLEGLSWNALRDRLDLLPLTTRGEIERDQVEHAPYGTNLTFDLGRYNRFHQTSGTIGRPVRWLDTPESWEWWKRCWSVVYRGAGLVAADRLVFPFSFGPFVGFWSAFEAAASQGNLCLPGGGMTTAARLRYMLDNEATVVCCTPTYALRMAEVAVAEGLDLGRSPVRMLIVAGEPGGSIPTVRERLEAAWGAKVIDHAGMTEVGAWGFECAEVPGGVHIIESEFLAEVIDPVSTEAVGEGESGELVLTNLGRWGSPLIRYRTGDHVRLSRGRCPCGRWFARAEGGILGRGDDMLFIRGNNVFPTAIEAILRGLPEVAEFRMEVDRSAPQAELRLDVEPMTEASVTDLAERVAAAVADQLHFRPSVHVVPSGSLPRFEMKGRRVIQ